MEEYTKEIQKLINKAHDQIDLDVLISNGLDEHDQVKYYSLLLKEFKLNHGKKEN